jgi:hypothetical protein
LKRRLERVCEERSRLAVVDEVKGAMTASNKPVGASTAQVGGGKRGLETRKQVAWNEHRMKAFFSVYSMSQQY